jgi:putative ABC transport system permease protein
MLVVQPGSNTAGGARGGAGTLPTLTWDDLAAIQTQVPAVKYAAPYLRTGSSIISEDSNWSTQIGGTSPEWFSIREWRAAQGALFTQSDVDGATKAIVLGKTVSDQLFGVGVDPIGQQVRVRNVPFQVVGVLAAKGQSSFGQDLDDIALMPYTTFLAKVQGGLKNLLSGQIVVGAAGAEYTTPAENQIRALLRDRHRLSERAEDDFQIRNLADAASAMDESIGAIALLLKFFAAVSLVVGGIGIMNIMLVSVTERTREIGVRMAVGARGRDVLLQFLTEAMVLATLGGVIGVGAGIGLASLAAHILGWSLLFRPDVIALAVTVSGFVGVVFGAYPARRASLLDPITALRFE